LSSVTNFITELDVIFRLISLIILRAFSHPTYLNVSYNSLNLFSHSCLYSPVYPTLLSLVLLYNLPFKPSTILNSCSDLIFLLNSLCGHISHPILCLGTFIWTIYCNNDKLYIVFLYNHLQDPFVYLFHRYYIFLPFAPHCNLDSSVCSLVFPITAPYVYKFTL